MLLLNIGHQSFLHGVSQGGEGALDLRPQEGGALQRRYHEVQTRHEKADEKCLRKARRSCPAHQRLNCAGRRGFPGALFLGVSLSGALLASKRWMCRVHHFRFRLWIFGGPGAQSPARVLLVCFAPAPGFILSIFTTGPRAHTHTQEGICGEDHKKRMAHGAWQPDILAIATAGRYGFRSFVVGGSLFIEFIAHVPCGMWM